MLRVFGLTRWWVLCLCLAATPAFAAVERFIAGQHYQIIEAPVATRDAAKVEVVEAFSYGCNHCRAFDPLLETWRRGIASDVDFHRVPVAWNPQFKLLAQAYFASEALGVDEKAHSALFVALHDERRPLLQAAALAQFYSGYGTSAVAFSDALNSFGVRASVEKADAKARAYGVKGVPAMVVGGKYLVTGELAGSNEAMLQVVDFLVAKERLRIQSAAKAGGP